jgi:hypothetical protein
MLTKQYKFQVICWIFLATTLLFSTQNAHAQEEVEKNVLFVLDASNSMWGQIDGRPKIDIAKTVLTDLSAQMASDTKMGLVAYGHLFDRKLKECTDMELVIPIGQYSAAQVDNSFRQITPKGQTPIANTLNAIANWLPAQSGKNTTIVLISDGLESCDGDPCAAARNLNDAGVSTAIHVVGFDLTSEQSAKLQCIADYGNGKMFLASDAKGLSEAMNEIRTQIEKPVAIQEAPEPKISLKSVEFFKEEFTGDGLDQSWSVANEMIDNYIAESGELLIIAAAPATSPQHEEMPNVISNSVALPDGDWDIEVKFKVELQHGSESFYFGVRNDNENWMAGGLTTTMASGQVSLDGFLMKVESGKSTRFDTVIQSSSDTDYADTTARWRHHGLGDVFHEEAFTVVLSKRGRNYDLMGSYGAEGTETYRSFKTESLKMLRTKKDLFLAFGLDNHSEGSHQGEGNVIVDYVMVKKVGE